MIQLVNLSTENIEDCLKLTVHPWQRELVPPIAASIARSYVDPNHLLPLGIERNKEMIGFVWLHFDKEKKMVTILSYLLDESKQRQGLGPEGLIVLLRYIEPMEDYTRVVAHFPVGNTSARTAFEKAGFQRGPVDLDQRTIEVKYATR